MYHHKIQFPDSQRLQKLIANGELMCLKVYVITFNEPKRTTAFIAREKQGCTY